MTILVDLDGTLRGGFPLRAAFEVPPRGVTAILGPSGSGKTSLLRALAGLERIAGTVRVGGMLWQDHSHFVPAERRRAGFVFQGAGLLPHLCVGANLAYAARRAGPGPFVRHDVIARTGIAHLLDHSATSLSGGETQRAGIARALLGQPRLLLMDEPLSALDSDARATLLAWLEMLLAEIDIPMFYVTHDEHEAARLADRTIRVKDGQVQS